MILIDWSQYWKMPELPEVRSITMALKVLEGCSIISLRWNLAVDKINKDVAPFVDRLAMPAMVTLVEHHGKQIFIHLIDSNQTLWIFNSFMGMSGRWSWTQGNHTMIILDMAEGSTRSSIFFLDPRHMGHLKILTPQEMMQKKSKMGPDLYQHNINWELWANRWHQYMVSHPNHHICQALMDQDHFAGIGNYLKAEILYAARISPHRAIIQLNYDDMVRLYQVTFDIIKRSVEAGGLTIKDFWHPDGKAGTFQQIVYGKKTDPLGNPVIVEDTKDTRTSHWVPMIQI